MYAEIAQLVEHFTRNEGVVGSSPIFSFYVASVMFPCLRFFHAMRSYCCLCFCAEPAFEHLDQAVQTDGDETEDQDTHDQPVELKDLAGINDQISKTLSGS